jgi:methylmalonyl-CoA mutase N-terminal domain/subunit
MRLVTDIFEWCSAELPRWNTISISGYHIREAGSTAVQELAFTLANAIAYVESAMARGLAVDRFAPQLSFFFNAHNNFFEEVAKFRAARRLWARIMKEKFGAANPDSWKLRFHAQTGGSTLTAQQIDTNVVRVTLQALAAVLGGCQSLHTNARDEALALPTEESARLALRTQQVIAFESGVADTVDPLGGSYYVENLTDRMELEVKAYLKRVEELGGSVHAIEKGFFQQEIARSAYEHQRAVELGAKTVVGVNAFEVEEPMNRPLLRIDEGIRQKQIERLRSVRARRDADRVRRAIADLQESARVGSNLLPVILQAVESYATVGEIAAALKDVWGEYGA